MQLEDYGITKCEYRSLIEDETVKMSNLAEKMTIPKKVYRYRRLGCENKKGEWVESKHWEDDVNGICMFSIPDSFNKNDPDDCKVTFDDKEIFNHMFCAQNREQRRRIKRIGEKNIKEYRKTLQSKMRVGCFTSVKPEDKHMWDDKNFGDKGRGICIEYDVDDVNFHPDMLSFLPVLYDDLKYDNTLAMKAVIDYVKNEDDSNAQKKMVCLGYGHTLIKGLEYENEKEWRLVIPIRDDGAHLDYYNVDHLCKRDFTSAIKAIYLGPNFDMLEESEKYKEAIIKKWKNNSIPVYRILFKDGGVIKERC